MTTRTPLSSLQKQKLEKSLRREQSKSSQIGAWMNQHWMLTFSILYGSFVGIPFLAPVFMQLGWEAPARAIYFFYTFLCHQMPQRSFFLFGQESMYDLSTIQAAWKNTINPLVLRQFVGNPEMGWKVAWSDRMVSMYTSILFAAWIWYPLRKKLKTLPLWGFVLLALPMAIDGTTHLVSDFAGIGLGFRDTNVWLAELTNNAFSASFYVGDNLGSFNSLMRFITGTLFGIGAGWYMFPLIEEMTDSFLRMRKLRIEQNAKLKARMKI